MALHPFKSDRGGFCIDCRPTRVSASTHEALAQAGIEDVNAGPLPGEFVLGEAGPESPAFVMHNPVPTRDSGSDEIDAYVGELNAHSLSAAIDGLREEVDVIKAQQAGLSNQVATMNGVLQKMQQFIGAQMQNQNGTGPTERG